jgi:hypothetical protein
MKTMIPLFCLCVGFIMAVAPARAASGKDASPKAKVEVVFDHPEKFTDIKDSYMDTEKGRESVLATLKDYLVEEAQSVLPADQSLVVTFTDIDLAGDYEPWRTNARDVRIIKDIYPPRMDFSYKVTDASGKVVKEGVERLRDLGFMSRMTINRRDQFSYEKDMLNDWVRSTLRPAKK